MLNRFVTRIHRYAVKRLANGATRLYVQNADALQQSGLLKNCRVSLSFKRGRIEATLDKNGTHKIMDTARGELFELKNKDTTKALGDAQFVTITFRTGKLIITIHGMDEAQQKREQRIIDNLLSGKPLRTACLFSGLGMLSYWIKQGLALQGIKTEICFANDMDELAMSCNLAGNPMWENATADASAVVDSLNALHLYDLPQSDFVTIGYPCVGQSSLATEENRDLNHPTVGTLFVPLVNALRRMNPGLFIIENTPRFGASETLSLLQRSMPDYNFTQRVFDGHDYNELESRKRVAIIAVSKGLPAMDLSDIPSQFNNEPVRTVNDILEPMPLDAACWDEMAHVKARDNMKHLGYRNCLYFGDETKMVTIPASYGPRKAGTPMIAHPETPELQRQVMPNEHANLRELPGTLKSQVMKVWKGTHPLVSKRGSFSAANRLLGNGVSRRIWTSMGAALGLHLLSAATQPDTLAA
ncbi:MAG: hypothetical protein CMJ50_00070 [Planctomycetaceae bacterium]|nr:hypothetical protein [Planctomycetaceae bacterium]